MRAAPSRAGAPSLSEAEGWGTDTQATDSNYSKAKPLSNAPRTNERDGTSL